MIDGISSEILAYTGSALTTITIGPYLWNIWKGRARPHVFSWVIWSLLMTIAVFAQLSDGAGVGVLPVAIGALWAGLIGISAYFNRGEKYITITDWWAFWMALAAIPMWWLTEDALTAVIIVTFIDFVAFYPTYRKYFVQPHDDMLMPFYASCAAHALGVLALENFTWTTALYPCSLVVMILALILMTWFRRAYTVGK